MKKTTPLSNIKKTDQKRIIKEESKASITQKRLSMFQKINDFVVTFY